MGTHSAPVNRAGSNASDTSVALAFSWAVSAGTGSNPVNASDFPGGTFPSGTGTIPAGSASATITFQSNPDATFEQDETGILTLTTTQNGITITGSPQPFTITNDDADPGSGPTTMTFVYGPVDGAGDSNEVFLQSTLQQCGRTWASGAPRWKAAIGQNGPGNGATYLRIVFRDDLGSLTYSPFTDGANQGARAVTVTYTGANPSATEPYTYVRSDANGIKYYCATSQPTTASSSGANERLLVSIPFSIWDDVTFWGTQQYADRVPGQYAQANAELQVANGIYAARLGSVQ